MRKPFWSDDFDMDLLRVLPELPELLGDTAGVVLRTTNRNPTFGRINLPCCWDSDLGGHDAFFGYRPEPYRAQGYWTDAPEVACTFEELVRDGWAHHLRCYVDRWPVWDATRHEPQFGLLMDHVRRWRVRSPAEVWRATDGVRRAVVRARQRLLWVMA